MKRCGRRSLRWVFSGMVALPVFQLYSGCVTDVQLQDFIRSQAALTLTNLLTAQLTGALTDLNQDLTGPQVTDEIIRTPVGPN